MRKAFVIGLGALLILCGLGLWLANSKGLLPGHVQLRAYTDDASGLTEGTKVRVDGIPIGYLDHQRLTGSRDPGRRVEFDMKVQRSYLSKIPVDSVLGVVAENLMGDLTINITRGQSPEHVEPGAELRTVKAVDPSRVMAQIGNEMQALQAIADRFTNLLAGVDAGRGTAGKLNVEWQKRYGGLPDEAHSLIDDYRHAHGTIDKLLVNNDEWSKQVQTTRDRIDDIMQGLQGERGAAGEIQRLRKDLDRTKQELDGLQTAMKARMGDFEDVQRRTDDLAAKLDGIVRRINAGQGTIGQLVVNPQLSEALDHASAQFQGVVKEMQANPRKFFTFQVRLF